MEMDERRIDDPRDRILWDRFLLAESDLILYNAMLPVMAHPDEDRETEGFIPSPIFHRGTVDSEYSYYISIENCENVTMRTKFPAGQYNIPISPICDFLNVCPVFIPEFETEHKIMCSACSTAFSCFKKYPMNSTHT